MAERVQMIVPAGTRAHLVRKGKRLLAWPPGSVVEHDLEEGDQIVTEELRPVPAATPLEILKVKADRADRELAELDASFNRFMDAVLERLIAGNVMRLDQLPAPAQAFWQKRKAVRNRIAQLQAEIQALADKP
ncbi:MAG: hypothetical protein BWX88_05187 [Planctomycetes bacterium ADurb.Bin126]|nr:MAG: hypothetical protein BWX88_05187 [Planctomycetes bacterium ADurb.Bin126]HOD84867.1 hypothetical protein [Phycisphaerae bacterium]HQL76510.1 hypothetical protein [Phycisphaerae bacterium]